MQIKVSIVIPTYKGLLSVENSIRSALNQTIESKEIIVVDDNGLENEYQIKTEALLQKYIHENDVIYIKHDVNKNGAAARNTGMRAAKGEYITFLDDDDYILPTKLEKQVKMLESDPDSVMCASGGCYVNVEGIGYHKHLHYTKDFLYDYLLDKEYFNTTAILFRKNALESLGGFDESFTRHQDWELMVRVLSEYKACVIDENLMYRYIEGRNHPSSLDQRIRYLDYFLEQRIPTMEKVLNKKQIQNVILYKKRAVTQNMIKSKCFSSALQYSKEYGGAGELFFASSLMIPQLFKKLLFGIKKVAPSKLEISSLDGRSF